ncbi:DUF262 domain-containing protein [Luteibacter aegosomatissinici]|uniref:DUF262 domain-containing protein n=1 Tax=Luteibacter aegosomatissinici TaxID=2911539 RepID=UPI001FFA3D6E|nr:DUF262 domain-containing protein [Luteibacter aegosomatissinici]UPG93899.1 DUF262 domain-containing protein [Luteibacter aegosomatissinici]
MISYHVRSRDLITVINEIKAGRLILDAYFQRALVWREAHKQDFIKTLLLGLPCPQIFVSKGAIDVERMLTTSCVVDGQQRLNAISEFIDGEFKVDGRAYQELSGDEKSAFLKYELATIELDVDNNDPVVKEIFQRLNRTANSLTSIEKLASQYAPSEYMLVASHLADELEYRDQDEDLKFRVDPAIDPAFFAWADAHPAASFSNLIQDSGVFRSHELSRKVHIMYVLNLMSTYLSGFFNRNERSRELLDEYANDFPEKEDVISVFCDAAELWKELNIPPGSYWCNKANFFTLITALATSVRERINVDVAGLAGRLETFAGDVPADYRLAATEAVNNTRQRELRHGYVWRLIVDN